MKTIKIFFTLLIFLFLSFTLLAGYNKKGYQYIAPEPGAVHVSAYSTIIVRFETISPDELSNLSSFIELKDAKDRTIAGAIKIAYDQKTIVFTPSLPFSEGEPVFVSLLPELLNPGNNDIQSIHYQFTVSKSAKKKIYNKNSRLNSESIKATSKLSKKSAVNRAVIMPNGVSVPADFPHVNITLNNNPDDGYIFLNHSATQGYNMILDNTGSPIWYSRAFNGGEDFKVQRNGILTMLLTEGNFIGLDQHYTVTGSFNAGNGYITDFHELQVLEDGSYLIIGCKQDFVDMSEYIEGGDPNATVIESAVQYVDSSGTVISEFRGWDHYNITDMDSSYLMSSFIYFPHMNAIDVDDDGNIVVSCRNLCEISKINLQEGEFIWRLGGANSDFTFTNDPFDGFKYQHDIRSLGSGHYTLFDNGDYYLHPMSRAVEYELDTDTMTANLVWQYYDPEIFSFVMGNVQRLPNGNTLIGWSDPAFPLFTEVTSTGEKAFELNFVEDFSCYRIHRFPWDGMSLTPYLIAEANVDNVALLFNKFGDPDVDYYRIYCDTSPNPTTEFDTSKATLKNFTNLENMQEYYFRVTAVYSNGNESDFSNEERVFVHYINIDSNLVLNGDFSANMEFWQWSVMGTAAAECIIDDEIFKFEISQGGEDFWYIQLAQDGIRLMQGLTYHFEFDARADQDRIIQVRVMAIQDPWTDYSQTGSVFITETNQHYSYVFEMEDLTDNEARVVFWAGTSNEDVYIDNVSLKITNSSDIDIKNNHTPFEYKLKGNYPNPFNAHTTICFSLATESRVNIKLYNLLGQFVKEITRDTFQKGEHRVSFNGEKLSSGIYFYTLEAVDMNGNATFRDVKKMLIIK